MFLQAAIYALFTVFLAKNPLASNLKKFSLKYTKFTK